MLLTSQEQERLLKDEAFLKILEEMHRMHAKTTRSLITSMHTELKDIAYLQGKIMTLEYFLGEMGKPIIK